MANTYLTRSLSSTSTSWTISLWVKRSLISSNQFMISWGSSGSSTSNGIGFSGADLFQYFSEATSSNPASSAVYRDTNGWYHLVVKNNAGTITFYVNGEAITTTGGTSGSALSSSTFTIGRWTTGEYSFNGSMSHVHLTDGTAYDATAFGEYDANGVWKIKTSPSVTYGTNGFFILKDGNSVTDQSGNGNNFTVAGGTLTNTEDNPSNVFATLNPLAKGSSSTFSNGNLTCTTGGANNTSTSTIGVSSGKWYWEYKLPSGSLNYVQMGITTNESSAANTDVMTNFSGANYVKTAYAAEFRYNTDGGAYSTDTYGGTQSVNDIFQIALDLENSFIYMGVNGTYFNSGDPTSGASGTGAAKAIVSGLTYFPMMITLSNSMDINFGNGYFGTTAVSSAGTNASGNGIFEYDCPTGYTALSTKGLNL